jgi:hypothetical protein
MTIEIKGEVTFVGKPEKITEKFTKHEFVVQTESGQYPKQVCVQATPKQLENVAKLKVGDQVEVKAGLNSKEHKGKYYTSIDAFFIKTTPTSKSAMQPNMEFDNSQASDNDTDDLPF